MLNLCFHSCGAGSRGLGQMWRFFHSDLLLVFCSVEVGVLSLDALLGFFGSLALCAEFCPSIFLLGLENGPCDGVHRFSTCLSITVFNAVFCYLDSG